MGNDIKVEFYFNSGNPKTVELSPPKDKQNLKVGDILQEAVPNIKGRTSDLKGVAITSGDKVKTMTGDEAITALSANALEM